MECYPVSRPVNNVRNEMAACVERVEVAAATEGLKQLLLL